MIRYLLKFQGRTVFQTYDLKRAKQKQARYTKGATKIVSVPVTR